jgi:hypothetical protein
MSRNLGETVCVHCGHPVQLQEKPRLITKKEAGKHFGAFMGLLVAKAECPICLAKYLAWIDETNFALLKKEGREPRKAPYGEILDLSYRSTFNDQPGNDDLPEYDVQTITTWHRVAKIR